MTVTQFCMQRYAASCQADKYWKILNTAIRDHPTTLRSQGHYANKVFLNSCISPSAFTQRSVGKQS